MTMEIKMLQNGSYFKFEKTSLILQQYSSDIPVHIEYDGTYNDYFVSWRFSKNIENDKTYLLKYDSDIHVLTLPYAMLSDVSNNCSVYLQAKFVKGDTVVHSNVIKILIKQSLQDTQIVSPDEPSDITLITDIVDQKFKIDVIPQIEQITKDAKQYRDEAKTSADQAETTLNEVVETADREKVQIIKTASNETQKACVAIEAYKNDKNAELQTSVDGWKGEISAQGNEIIQDANVILTDVSTISETVSENAETVKTSTQQAETYRDDAGRHASNADLSAQGASASAENALTSKADAETAENNAKASETIASQKASDASASEKKAKEYWANAQAEAFNANRSATSALESKNSAQNNADAIRSSAEKINQNSEAINQLRESSFSIALIKRTEGYTVSINDSANYYPKSIGMYGETHQTTTTGEQLLDFKNGTNVKNVTENSFDIIATNDKDRICVFKHNFVVGEKYVLSYSKTPGVALGAYIRYVVGGYVYFGSGQVFTVEKEVAEFAIYVAGEHIGKTSTITNPMLNKGATALSFEPYTRGFASPSQDYTQEMISKVVSEIKVTGAQLFDASKISSKTQGGATVANNGDGGFSILGNGELTSQLMIEYKLSHAETIKIFKKGKLILLTEGITHPYVFCNLSTLMDGKEIDIIRLNNEFNASSSKEITDDILLDKDCRIRYGIYGNIGKIIHPGTIKPFVYQLGDGTFEPYKEQKVTLSQPITLRGLPVTSGGNVTIDGKQYISDSIELVNGIYGVIRRIGVVDNAKWLLTNVSTGTSGQRFYFLDQNIKLQRYATIMCTHYTQRNVSSFSSEGDYISSDEAHDKRLLIRTLNKQFDNIQSFIDWTKETNMETLYQLENEIIEPLPLADQQAIKELQTYSHNTNITADGAWLSVEYVADQQINNDRLIKRLEALEGVVVNNV